MNQLSKLLKEISLKKCGRVLISQQHLTLVLCWVHLTICRGGEVTGVYKAVLFSSSRLLR